MDDINPARKNDSRDTRTWEGDAARPVEGRDMLSEARSTSQADDPVSALDPEATPSDYSMEEIERGENPLDDEMAMLVDPSMGEERMSSNLDVLDLDSSWRVEGEEPDFMQSPGATDMIESIEEGEPYFPPTDPPLTTRPLVNAGIQGGFAATSLEEQNDDFDHPLRLRTNDEDIEERVRFALASDAYTSDLNIEVEVADGVVSLHGMVRSIEDIEQAEQVVGSVQGVEEVEEDLEIV